MPNQTQAKSSYGCFAIIGFIVTAFIVVGAIIAVVSTFEHVTPPKEITQETKTRAAEPKAKGFEYDLSGLHSDPAKQPPQLSDKEAQAPHISHIDDGCDEKARASAMEYAVKQALPKDPFEEPLKQLSGFRVVWPDDAGEPLIVRDEGLQTSSMAVCVYSTPEVGVYVPTSVFTARMRSIRSAELRLKKELGMEVPAEIFSAMTYWSFKQPIGSEFQQFFPADFSAPRARYEGRMAMFDTNRKLALFTTEVCVDSNGQEICFAQERQRLELSSGDYPVTLKVAENMERLLNSSDRSFSRALDAQR
jgi:hypothetical protein